MMILNERRKNILAFQISRNAEEKLPGPRPFSIIPNKARYGMKYRVTGVGQ